MMAFSKAPRLGLVSQSPPSLVCMVFHPSFACAKVILSPCRALPARSVLAPSVGSATLLVEAEGGSLLREGLSRLSAVPVSVGTFGLRAAALASAPNSSPVDPTGRIVSHCALVVRRRAMTAKRLALSDSPSALWGCCRRLSAARQCEGTGTLVVVTEVTATEGSTAATFLGTSALRVVARATVPKGSPYVKSRWALVVRRRAMTAARPMRRDSPPCQGTFTLRVATEVAPPEGSPFVGPPWLVCREAGRVCWAPGAERWPPCQGMAVCPKQIFPPHSPGGRESRDRRRMMMG